MMFLPLGMVLNPLHKNVDYRPQGEVLERLFWPRVMLAHVPTIAVAFLPTENVCADSAKYNSRKPCIVCADHDDVMCAYHA